MKISIIIPCYNININLFNRCLNSIKSQSIGFNNIQVIVVDDCSTINSDYLINICNQYENVIYCKTDSNGGCGVARNKGFEYVKCDYYTIIDHDDYYYDNNVIQDTYDIMSITNTDVLFGTFAVYSYVRNFNQIEKNNYKVYTNKNDAMYILSYPPLTSAKCWKTSFIKDNKIYNYPYRNSQDMLFFIETFFAANTIVIYNRTFVNYCIQPNSVTNIKTSEALITRLQAKKEYDKIAIKNGIKNLGMLSFNLNWILQTMKETNIKEEHKDIINNLIYDIRKLES